MLKAYLIRNLFVYLHRVSVRDTRHIDGSAYPNYHLEIKSRLLTERMRFMRRRFCDVSKVVVNLGYAWTMSAHFEYKKLEAVPDTD